MQSSIDILNNARSNGLTSSEVLPLLGITPTRYKEFIFNEVFMKGLEDAEFSLNILVATEPKEISELYELIRKATNLKEAFDLLKTPYIDEYVNYKYLFQEREDYNPKRTISESDIESASSYRTTLYRTADTMEDLGQQLYTRLINIAMSGELNTVDKIFETGEVMEFKETDFRYLGDQNAQLVLKVLDAIAESYSSLININKLNRDLADNDEFPF